MSLKKNEKPFVKNAIISVNDISNRPRQRRVSQPPLIRGIRHKTKRVYSRQELEEAADRVFHNISQLFGYYAWVSKIAPCLDQRIPGAPGHLYFNLAQNAVVDGFLINLRRLNEFFSKRPKQEKWPDGLRAYDFGFAEIGRFLKTKDMKEIHKRVAHSTIHAARYGDCSWEALRATELALEHSFKFLEYLLTSFYVDGSPQSDRMKDACIHLASWWTSWREEAQKDKK